MSKAILYLEFEELDLLEELLEYAIKKTKDESKKEYFVSMRNKAKYTQRIRGKGYLDGLSNSLKEYLDFIQGEYNLNIYHSFTSVIHNSSEDKDRDFIFDIYKDKYMEKRPLVFKDESKLKAIFDYAYKRVGYRRRSNNK